MQAELLSQRLADRSAQTALHEQAAQASICGAKPFLALSTLLSYAPRSLQSVPAHAHSPVLTCVGHAPLLVNAPA